MDLRLSFAAPALERGDPALAIELLRSGQSGLDRKLAEALADYLERGGGRREPGSNRRARGRPPKIGFDKIKATMLAAVFKGWAAEDGVTQEKAIAEQAAREHREPTTIKERVYRPNRKRPRKRSA
jgi:hypothetical protein